MSKISKIEKEIVYEFLRKLFKKKTSNAEQEYTIFNNIRYVELSTQTLKKEFEISPFKQRNILNELLLENKIHIKLGHGRTRYFSLDKSEMVNIIHLREDILRKLKSTSDLTILGKIKDLLQEDNNERD